MRAKRKRSPAPRPANPQRRRLQTTQRATDASGAAPSAAFAGGKLALCEVGERVVLSFLPLLPERLAAERVCRRWRRVSQLETATHDLDFGSVAPRLATKQRVAQLVRRAGGQLRTLALPDAQLDDAVVQSVCENAELRALCAHRMAKKHVFQILAACPRLKSLELLDCQGIQLAGWGRGFPRVELKRVVLNDCNLLTNAAASSLVQMCGDELEKLVLTGATSLDSQILQVVSRTSTLSELTMTYCRNVEAHDLERLVEAQVGLHWLDFSFCGGLALFPTAAPPLVHLEALLLDRTRVSDDGLRAIARIAPQLKYLSLQDCCNISDAGVLAFASTDVASPDRHSALELIDLKGTSVTDKSVLALERACVRLRMVRLDSCRSVSRAMRGKHSERVRGVALSAKPTEFERTFLSRRKGEFVDVDDRERNTTESASDSDFAVGGRRRSVSSSSEDEEEE